MNYKRIGRALVCLLLVCCLIVQTVPVKTEATGAGLAATIASASSVSVAAPLVVGASLVALGVMANNTNPLVFENVVNDAVDSLSAAGQWVVDGSVELLRTVDEAGNAMYYAAGEMLEGLRSWLFNEGEVLSTDTNCLSYNGNTYSFSNSASYKFASHSRSLSSDVPFVLYSVVLYGDIPANPGHPYHAFSFAVCSASSATLRRVSGSSSYDAYTRFSNGSLSICSLDSWQGHANLDSYYADCSGLVDLGVVDIGTSDSSVFFNQFLADASLADGITSSLDLSLGQISTVPIDGTSALDWAPEYQANRLKVIEGGNDPDPDSQPPNDGKWFWPLALALTSAELFAFSQMDEWSGQTPQEFNDYSTNTEFEITDRPEFDGYQGIELSPITNPSPNPGTNPDTGTDTDPGTDSDGTSGIDYTSWFKRIVELIEEFLDRFKTWVTDCKTAIEELPSKFADWFDKIIETLGDIWEWCKNLVSSLIDALKQLLVDLFVPSTEFIANKVNALCAKYPYLDTFLDLGTDLKAYFLSLGTKPPIIYIDLGASRGSLPLGGRQAFIDLTWYAEYKPTMDTILGAFIWLWLAWRVFHALPGIINGMSGTVGERTTYSGSHNIVLPPSPPQRELPPGNKWRS